MESERGCVDTSFGYQELRDANMNEDMRYHDRVGVVSIWDTE